jgi:predicted acyltransferase
MTSEVLGQGRGRDSDGSDTDAAGAGSTVVAPAAAPTVAAPTAAPGPAARSRRLRGLDVLRGLIVGWLLVVVYTPGSGLRGHAEWFGWDHSDVFFPMFVLTAGMGLAAQTRRGMPWGRLLRRFVTLIALGLLVNAWLGAGPDLSQLRYTGVLQRIALAGLVGALVVVLCGRRWWAVLGAAMATAVGWGLLLADASAGCPDGLPTLEGCGTFYEVEVRLFGAAHTYGAGTQTHDPEGLVSTLGALATFLAGYAAAALLLDLGRRSAAVRSAALLAVAGVWAAAFPLLLQLQPVAKRMWTPSFLAVHAAVGIAVLAVAVLAFDSERPRGLQVLLDVVSWPVVALGRNALVLWIGVFVVGKMLASTPSGTEGVPWGAALLTEHGPGGFFAITAGSWLALACAMHAARWYVRL